MNDLEIEKLKRFVNDKVLNNAVYKSLLDSFLSDCVNEVNMLAASRLSVDFLKRGWKDLDKYKTKDEDETKENNNIGL